MLLPDGDDDPFVVGWGGVGCRELLDNDEEVSPETDEGWAVGNKDALAEDDEDVDGIEDDEEEAEVDEIKEALGSGAVAPAEGQGCED